MLLALMAVAPARLSAQSGGGGGGQYAPADPVVPLPYGSTRPEDGGFYTFGKVLLYRQTNPLRQQVVAVRGLFAFDTGGQTVVQVVPNFIAAINGVPVQPINNIDRILDTGVNTGQLPAGTSGSQVVNGVQTTISQVPVIVNGAVVIVSQSEVTGFFVQELIQQTLPGLFDQPGFVGSNEVALDVQQLRQRNPYQPGMELGAGWKFRDGSSVALSWKYLSEVQHRAGATLAPPASFGNPPTVNAGVNLENTFLFSPVFNFPPEFAGADFKVNVPPGITPGNIPPTFVNPGTINVFPQTVFGIWNGASIMTLSFIQRFQQWEIAYREPVWETETYRVNGIVGPRYSWFWEKFKWTTTSLGQNPDGTINNNQGFNLDGPQNVGIYSNITSNRMYGVFAGCEQEWYLGHGIAVQLRLDGALFLDSVKEKAKYETAAKYLNLPQNKITKVEWSVVPEINASLGLMWYPTEFVQIYGGYDFMAFFNTRASPRPIDFDYSNINPRWTHVNRLIDGWSAGIGFTF